MANQSVPNNQITTYTHNGFRTDVNKVPMPYGLGVPLQPLYYFVESPALDSSSESICAFQPVTVGTPLTLNPTPTTYASSETAQQLFLAPTTTTYSSGDFAKLNKVASSEFNPTTLLITVTVVGTLTGTGNKLTVKGLVAPGVFKTEDLTVGAGASVDVTTTWAYIGVESIGMTFAGATSFALSCNSPTVYYDYTACSLFSPIEATGLVDTSEPLLSSAANNFPAQIITFSLLGVTSSTSNIQIKVSGLNETGTPIVSTSFPTTPVSTIASGGIAVITTGSTKFTSVTKVVLVVGGGTGTITMYGNVMLTNQAVRYNPVNGTSLSQMDCQRCILLSFRSTPTADSSVQITGYDDRNVMVQETLLIPKDTYTINSNKAYSAIQSIKFLGSPGGSTVTVGVSSSNQFFGFPFYYSGDALMTVALPANLGGDNAGSIGASVQTGNNFYKTTPNGTAVSSKNTYALTYPTGTTPKTIGTVSDLDARGIVGLNRGISSTTAILYYTVYLYGADSFMNAQLQSNNPIIQQQVSNMITGTNGAVVNDPTKGWTQNNWATTQLIPFDLTGCQYPGDQAEYNAIFYNSNLPTTVRRSMNPALSLT